MEHEIARWEDEGGRPVETRNTQTQPPQSNQYDISSQKVTR